VASLSQTNSTGENTQINLLKTRLDARIAGEYWLGSVNIIYPGASFGVIEVDPTVTDPDSALRAADVAMYQHKKGKSKTRFLAMD
jgi:diguanylate cyclase